LSKTTAKSAAPTPSAAAESPMMRQYREAKEAYPDCLLFFRMGDFFELFFEDAEKAAAALDITLTRRGQHGGEPIPMAGVPAHAHESYLARLIRKGFRVALCDQVESPEEAKKRGGKVLVRRDVVRVVTQGTVTEDALLEARANNYLAAIAEAGGRLGLAAVDITTGDLLLEPSDAARLPAQLSRLDPGELLISERLAARPEIAAATADYGQRLTPQPASRFDSENARRRLEALFGVETLDAYGTFGREEVAAAGALVDYIDLTQKGRFPRLAPPRRQASGALLEIDAATRRNLELTRTLAGERRGSLLDAIDRTLTGGGARLLSQDLASPLTDIAAIDARLDLVGLFAGAERARLDLRERLRGLPDMERALSRLTLGRGGPRDLLAIAHGLDRAAAVRRGLAEAEPRPALLERALADLEGAPDLAATLGRALDPDPPVLTRDGGFIARGYSAALDELRTLRDESRRLIAGLQADYAKATGIQALKIKHNNVIGYHVEVTPQHADKLATAPHDATFIHRQTLGSAVRFTTVELGDLEKRIAEAGDRALALELSLFEELAGAVREAGDRVAGAAAALARLDLAAALADLAVARQWTRPKVTDDRRFAVEGGRHPVVEQALEATGERFVANDCDLGEASRIWLLTGPNMAGKSTFLRQNALIALLAQIGAFVPAERAEIGVVDRLFSRVGAADDLARGRSTFMVEMVETAAILNQATERSLVILDEIGRGTATFDGLSIAWACVEQLHDVNRCRALFATHYHELTTLAGKLDALSPHAMKVKEWQGRIVFLHEVGQGAADRSYGIHVAELAGLPAAVVARAEEVLRALEEGEQGSSLGRLADDLPLFAATRERVAAPKPVASVSPALEALAAVNPDELTPRAALELIYELKAKAGET